MNLPTQPSPDTTTPCDNGDYYYDAQFKRYITQFMAIFAGMQVMVGASTTLPSRLIKVPIAYGSRDRVVSWIKSSQTQSQPLRIPAFSAFLRNVQLAPELRKGVGQTRRQIVARNNGRAFPENLEVVKQLMPVPYKMTFELCTLTSNDDQHFQIQEQIMMLFDPQLQIQTSDDPLDWTQITTVTLQGINWEENFPAGADKRITMSVLSFEVVAYLSGPAEFKNNYIESIKVRLAIVPTSTDFGDEFATLNAMNQSGAEYITIFDSSNIDIEKP